MLKTNELYEIIGKTYAILDHDPASGGAYIPSGDVVLLKELYEDSGKWSDDNPLEWESPFPATVVMWNGMLLSSIHTKVLKPLQAIDNAAAIEQVDKENK